MQWSHIGVGNMRKTRAYVDGYSLIKNLSALQCDIPRVVEIFDENNFSCLQNCWAFKIRLHNLPWTNRTGHTYIEYAMCVLGLLLFSRYNGNYDVFSAEIVLCIRAFAASNLNEQGKQSLRFWLAPNIKIVLLKPERLTYSDHKPCRTHFDDNRVWLPSILLAPHLRCVHYPFECCDSQFEGNDHQFTC